MSIRRKAVVIDGKKKMRRVMTPGGIEQRDELNRANTAEAIHKRAIAGLNGK